MRYDFPVITDIEQVRAAIAGREEFIEADRGDYVIFNYVVNFEDTFPRVTVVGSMTGIAFGYDERAAILRECRGLVFDKASGDLVARRYHKFFNYGEKQETLEADFTRPHVILEKLDGSMVTPIPLLRGDRRSFLLGTKMGDTDVAKNAMEFIRDSYEYHEFIGDCIVAKLTPIFEWCSRKNRIVVDYPEDRLVLTAVRNNATGVYEPYDSMAYVAAEYGIEVIKKFDLTFEEARATLSSITDEGYVVRFGDGHMLKMKGSHYLALHKTLEHVQHEKDLIRLIIDEKLDDAKPFLPPDLVKKLDDFGKKFFHNVRFLSRELAWSVIEDYDHSKSKKDYAARIVGKDETKIRFQAYDFIEKYVGDMWEELPNELYDYVYARFIERIKNNLSTASRVDSVRHLWGGLKWKA